MDYDVKVILICLGLFAFFCVIVGLVEGRKAKVRRRARKIFGKVKRREEATSIADTVHFNFRSTRWGMTTDEVKLAEELEDLLHEDENGHIFKTQMCKFPCKISYAFADEKLFAAMCHFDLHYENSSTYLDMFNKLIKRLMRVYGLPANRDIFWSEQASTLNLPFTITAVELGQAVYVSHWKTPCSVVLVKLCKGEEGIEITLHSHEASAKSPF